MAVYQCHNCDAWLDDDWHPMETHPWAKRFKKYQNDVVCPSCAGELEQEMIDAARDAWLDDDCTPDGE